MKYLLTAFAMLSMLLLSSCSDDSTSPANNNVTLTSSMSSSTVTSSVKNSSDIPLLDNTIEEIKINSVRILISSIKMHVDGEEVMFDAGPVLFQADAQQQSYTFAQAEIQNGSFNKIKYEFHRFPTSELNNWKDDPVFGDFATPERYTVIIEGDVVIAGQDNPFVYETDVVANLMFDFNPPVDVDDNSHVTVDFEFNTEDVFKRNGELMDPTDSKNRPHIDNGIKSAIKANKK